MTAVTEPSRSDYVAAVLDAYRHIPGAVGHVRASDRRLALRLFDDRIPLDVVRAALALAALRRHRRPRDAESLQPVRSLHYFKPVIAELAASRPDAHYLLYLQHALGQLQPRPHTPTQHASGVDDSDCS